MSTHLLPVLCTLFAWWFGTGAILYLGGRPRRTHPWTLGAATLLLAVALLGLVATRDDTRLTGACLAFGCVMLVWAWQEVAFLLGYVTGPRRTPCPAGALGWRRAGYALQTLLHHELALLVLGAAVVLATWGGDNLVGPACYAVLWLMRQSAKLNLFLGVRNLSESFLPAHLAYLQTYFRRRPSNALFPVSMAVGGWLAVLLWEAASVPGLGAFDAAALAFPATLLTLALLEHGFMVLPLPLDALWHWGLRSRTLTRPDAPS